MLCFYVLNYIVLYINSNSIISNNVLGIISLDKCHKYVIII